MKQKKIVAVVLALVMAVLILPTIVWAGNVRKFRDQGGEAHFITTEGCITTAVNVLALENRFQMGRDKSSLSEAIVTLFQIDDCTGEELFFGQGFTTLGDSDFQVDKKLKSATLNTSLDVIEFSTETPLSVNVNLTWTGTGELQRDKHTFHFTTGDCKTHGHFTGDARNGQASGSVSAGGTNLTPEPSIAAELFSAKGGSVDIGCGL